jgi:energy-coupling factor transport system ATP-binding protein
VKPTLPHKILAGVFAATLLASVISAIRNFDGFKAFISGGDLAVNASRNADDAWRYVITMLGIAAGAAGLAMTPMKKPDKTTAAVVAPAKRKLAKRTVAAAFMILLFIPLTIYIGYYFLGDRKYYFISLLIILETMLPFALVFEKRKPRARELVVVATLCAIAVAGRVAFFMLPQFKPVVAMVIISGVAFGGESGFLVGALTGLASNMFFEQGPWTPWQMFAFGIIGLLAGELFRKGLLSRSPAALAVFGGLATFLIYGGIMNSATVLMYQPNPTKEMFWAAYVQGMPFDLVHAAATVTFMLIISQPMLEKLDRIKVKYGLIVGI